MKLSHRLICLAARAVFAAVDALPMRAVVRAGRVVGALAYALTSGPRRVVLRNMRAAFPEWAEERVRAVAREHFKRVGEGFAASVKLGGMEWKAIEALCEFHGHEMLNPSGKLPPPGMLVALGHFGCFDLFAWATRLMHGFRCMTTYRALNPPALDRLFQQRRERSGVKFFERRFDGARLREAVAPSDGVMLGLVADQRGSGKGLRMPFLGRDCSVAPTPALFALRYRLRLHVALCERIGIARWKLSLSPEIPTHENGRPRSVEDIMRDVNAVFEDCIRRDPANWFWVHDRWKNPPPLRTVTSQSPADVPDESAHTTD
jgi:KDO2-lipid IV(A) lauroyltransferase